MNTKKEFQEMLINMLSPLEKHYSETKAYLKIGHTAAGYEDTGAYVEAFSRPLWGLVPFWAGGGENPEFEEIYLKGIISGSDPASREYWGVCHDRDQRFVEMAAFAYLLLLAPDKIWNKLNMTQKNNLAQWLYQINDHKLPDCNWLFFNILVNIALKKAGMPYSSEKMTEYLDRIESFYLGNGWYRDGHSFHKDYYVSFAIHFYSLIYVKFMEDEDRERCERYRTRAIKFGKSFIYWFDENGEALPYGRSLIYRFAQTSFWSACLLADCLPYPVGVIKGIIVRHIKKWMQAEIFDGNGILTLGYKYPCLYMTENYNAPASVYWCMKSFAFLALDDNSDFWKAECEPMPDLDKTFVIDEADMVISRRGGHVTAFVCGSEEKMYHSHTDAKYEKFAYSTAFGFSVPKAVYPLSDAAPDSTLCFYTDGLCVTKRRTDEWHIKGSTVINIWSPVSGITVESRVTPTEYGHMREHIIHSDRECTAYDTAFAAAARDCDDCHDNIGGNYAEVSNRFSICRIESDDGKSGIISAAPNTNLFVQKTHIPMIEYSVKKGKNVFVSRIYDKIF